MSLDRRAVMERKGRDSRLATGVFLVILGGVILLGRTASNLIGEALVALIGIGFLTLHFLGGANWAIYPGAFTTTVGTVIFLAARGLNMEVYWPLFILAPGLSFFIIRLASPDGKWAVIPGTIVSSVALFFFGISTNVIPTFFGEILGNLWPAVLIVIGLYLVVSAIRSRK